MEITINTSDILGDETTIRDEVIAQVVSSLTLSMRQTANEQLMNMITKELEAVVKDVVKNAVTIAVDTEYTTVGTYGNKGETASMRQRIANIIQSQCIFKTGGYNSDKNAFTLAVESITEKEVRSFKDQFTSLINKQVIEQSMNMAVATLKQSMGIK